MCGRIAITLPLEAMKRMFNATLANNLPPVPNYNICPTVNIHTVTFDHGIRYLRTMRWGLVPHWYKTLTCGPLLINARSETIAQKPAFREACRRRRFLIPVDVFYEWARRDGQTSLPYRVVRADGQPIVLAGIWQEWEMAGLKVTNRAIVTTETIAKMGKIHHWLPVILGPEEWRLWLGEAGKGTAQLMRPVTDETLGLRRVSQAVNSNRVSGLDLWAVIDAPASVPSMTQGEPDGTACIRSP